MLDELRHQIQTYLDELLGEVDKLRRALAALGSRDGAATAPKSAVRSASAERAGSASASRTPSRKPPRSRAGARTATPSASAKPAARRARTASRTAPGATKNAVLQALAGGDAMTAGEVASATGLGRGTVSTTLSKLATSGEVTKAARGYQLAGPTAAEVPADVGASSEAGELGE